MEATPATNSAELIQDAGEYPSKTPHYRFAETLEEQETQLADNPLLQRFAESRRRMASDPYRPAYHFVSPESLLNDPNGLTFWQGRWHLFYQAYPPDEFPDPADAPQRRQHWGHTVSDDLIHWRDLPYAIYPGVERLVFSGSTVVDGDRVIAFYPGIGAPGEPIPGFWAGTKRQMVAVSSDPLLLNWEKSAPLDLDDIAEDSDIWKEGDTYFGVLGGASPYYPEQKPPGGHPPHPVYGDVVAIWPKTALWSSPDLVHWHPEGELIDGRSPFTGAFDEASCPNFVRIGDKHILLFFSHKTGGQYLLGDYDEATHRFRPYDHGRFNHGQVVPDGAHAPSAAADGSGGVVNILNINSGHLSGDWDQIMSLPQSLTLGEDERVRIAPVASVASLRGSHVSIPETVISDDRELALPGVRGNTLELELEIDTRECRQVELDVLRSDDGEERTTISFFNLRRRGSGFTGYLEESIVLDGTRSTMSDDVMPRPPETATLDRGDENLRLRVFIDRSVVEVFVNERRYLAIRVYPTRKDSVGVAVRARGGQAVLKGLDAWQLGAIWPIEED